MPAGLWERLTRNLFSPGSEEEEAEARHPMEELLGNLLKSSARMKVQTPLGEAELDRKSLKDMSTG